MASPRGPAARAHGVSLFLPRGNFRVARALRTSIPSSLRALPSGGAIHVGHAGHASHASPALASAVPIDWTTLWATSVHTAGYLLVTGVLAVVVYERAALHLLRRAWINVDLIWAAALVLTGVAVAIM